MATPRAAFGLIVKLRTSLGADAVKASKTHGASNAQLVFTAKTAGAAGNSITIALVNPGGTAPIAVSVSGDAITVNLGVSAGAITSTANDVIAKIYATPTAVALIDVGPGAGTGVSVVTALAASPLLAGADGTSVYSVIEGVGDVEVPGLGRQTLDTTSHSSPSGFAQYVKSKIREGRAFSLPLKYDPTDVVHQALKAAEASDDPTSMQFIFPFAGSNFQSDVLVNNFVVSNPVKDLLSASVDIMLTGAPVSI